MVATFPTLADRIAALTALAVGASALVTLAAWIADLPTLAQWGPGRIAMQPNTALGMSCIGFGVALLGRSDRWPRALAIVAGVIGMATLAEHLLGMDLRIDQLLVSRDWGGAATSAPGRMGPPASLSLSLLGAAIAIATLGRGHWARSAAWALAAMTACIALVPFTGYVTGAASLYSRPHLTAISMQTAASLVVVSIALLARVRDPRLLGLLRSDSAAGLLARRVLPAIVIVPIVLAWLYVRTRDAGWFGPEGSATLFVISVILWCALVLWWGVEAVDARERALAALHERQRLAEMALANSRDQLTIVDAAWRYVYVSERVLELNGETRDSMLGLVLWDKYPQLVGSQFERVARGAMERRERATHDYLHPVRRRWYEVRMEPTPDGGLALLAIDVTERKLLEEELSRSARSKDEFLATLAHELRNPLAPIRTSLELIRRASGDPAIVARARATAERQLALVIRLIDDLLDLSRITRNKLVMQVAPVALQDVLHDAVETTRPQFESAGTRLHVDVPEAPVALVADGMRLSQVFANLLGNACKYSDPGSDVHLAVHVRGEEVVVDVRDAGIGIPVEMLDRIFEMFVQVDNSLERSRGGLGIGLTLVRQIVALHHGSVTVRSEGPGRGSAFSVHLPLADTASAHDVRAAAGAG
ncbi:MAG TPA: HAMP domain-containing sensor histidine kinase [Xanthomonadales bacterium]|nr:HAMP domain-containing sensor histidine kinase [Xanthomonadales bacterium]